MKPSIVMLVAITFTATFAEVHGQPLFSAQQAAVKAFENGIDAKDLYDLKLALDRMFSSSVRKEEPGKILLRVPANAVVTVGDQLLKSMGEDRLIQSPPLEVGYDYSYTIRVRWGSHDLQKIVTLRAGQTSDFAVEYSQQGPIVTARC